LTYVTADAVNHLQLDSNEGRTFLVAWTSNASSTITLTLKGRACKHGRSQDSTMSAALGQYELFVAGPFEPGAWNQDDGTVQVDCSGTDATFNVGAVRMNRRA
jgi:hypothetical protein